MARPSREAEIMAGALAVFAERGYDATRVRDIARRAGVSEGALYSHHASKEDVALALFRTHMGRYSERLRQVEQTRVLSVRERIEALAMQSLDAYAEEPEAFAFVLGHQARFIGSLPADFAFPIQIVERLIRKGQRDGSVCKGPVRVLAALTLGCVLQPLRTAIEAPVGTIDVSSGRSRRLIAAAAWAAIASSPAS